jgi:hypothetical protein
MKNRKRMGGIVRLVILIIILAAAVAGIRLAAGRLASGRAEKEAAEQVSRTETGSAAGSTAQENADPLPLSSAGEEGDQGVLNGSSKAGESADGLSSDGFSADGLSSDGLAPDGLPSDGSSPDGLSADGLSADAGGRPAAVDGATAAAADSEEEKPAFDHVTTELENGHAYLASLDARTPVEMEYMISEAQKEHEKELEREAYRLKREEYRESLEGNHVWEAFDDFVFLGDSRVVGFDVFGLLPSDRVLADAGDTINSITDRMDTIKSLSPKYIFISYGINDIGMGFWPTAEEYASAFSEKLHELQRELPDAEIYVNSIIPARGDAEQAYPIWQGLPEYSEAVRRMCEREKFAFIDNASMIEEHMDLYDSDGVHMQPDFYRYWAENQLLAVFDRKNGVLTF